MPSLCKPAEPLRLVLERSSWLGGALKGEAPTAGPAPGSWPGQDLICERLGSSYLVSAKNVREAAKETFIFMITFHQEMEIFLWL